VGRKEWVSFNIMQGVPDSRGWREDDKKNVDTLIYIIVSRLRQWGGVGKRGEEGGGREAEVGSKLGLSQIPPAAP
jgi:hypothetical protein